MGARFCAGAPPGPYLFKRFRFARVCFHVLDLSGSSLFFRFWPLDGHSILSRSAAGPIPFRCLNVPACLGALPFFRICEFCSVCLCFHLPFSRRIMALCAAHPLPPLGGPCMLRDLASRSRPRPWCIGAKTQIIAVIDDAGLANHSIYSTRHVARVAATALVIIPAIRVRGVAARRLARSLSSGHSLRGRVDARLGRPFAAPARGWHRSACTPTTASP